MLGWFPTKIEAIKDSIVANDKALDGKDDKENDLKIQFHTNFIFQYQRFIRDVTDLIEITKVSDYTVYRVLRMTQYQ